MSEAFDQSDYPMNKKQFLNYNSKINSNYLNYASPILNNGNNTNNINNINNNNGNKPNEFYIQIIEEEPQQLRINTVINTLGPSFSSSANNSITTKNKNKTHQNLWDVVKAVYGRNI